MRGKPPEYETLGFFELLTLGVHVEYQPLSFAELAQQSEVVAIGRLKSVAEGRTIGGPRESRLATFFTSVGNVEVIQTTKGEPRVQLFVELRHSPVVETKDLMARLPRDLLLLFLFDTAKYPAKNVFDSGKGFPADEKLFGVMTPLGMVVERDGGLAFPLEPDSERWLKTELTSLDEVAAISGSRDGGG